MRLLPLLPMLLLACARPHYQDPPLLSEKVLSAKAQVYFPQHQLSAKINWEKFPTEDGYGSFLLHFFLEERPHQPVDLPGDVAVVLWMPSMGHGSSPVKIEEISRGRYHVTRVFFNMPGEWDIRLQIKREGKILEQIILPVKI